MQPLDIVRFKASVPGEDLEARYLLLDDPTMFRRIALRTICDLPFAPVRRAKVEDIYVAEENEAWQKVPSETRASTGLHNWLEQFKNNI